MCLLVNVPTTFVSSTGASAVAVAATAAAGTSATASPVAHLLTGKENHMFL